MMPPQEALLRFPGHAPLLADHFPGAPRVPGSCLLEAMFLATVDLCRELNGRLTA